MLSYHGAIDYMCLKSNKKHYTFFLDNHQPDSYCSIRSQNIDGLFDGYMEKEPDNTLILLEELVGEVDVFPLFDSKHLEKFKKFSKRNLSRESVYPVDIRFVFKKWDRNFVLGNMNYLFDMGNKVEKINSSTIVKVKEIVDEAILFSASFETMYCRLKEDYGKLSKVINEGMIGELFAELTSSVIETRYPFEPSAGTLAESWNRFLSSLLEMYVIALLICNDKKYNFVYLGAAHCVTICSILVKYFDFKITKPLDIGTIHIPDDVSVDLKLLDNSVSCIDYKLEMLV
jgi:hypothetical protein